MPTVQAAALANHRAAASLEQLRQGEGTWVPRQAASA